MFGDWSHIQFWQGVGGKIPPRYSTSLPLHTGSQLFGEITFSLKIVLSCIPQDNLDKKGTFSGLNSGQAVPNTIYYCRGWGGRIILYRPSFLQN